jgi:hypothetical protein
LRCMFTLDLMEMAIASAKLADGDRSTIIFSALRHARMRVPVERRAEIVQLIGKERARDCSSLGPMRD